MKPLHLTDKEFIESVNRLGMSLYDFCEMANISIDAYDDLMTSYGGQNYLLEQLDKAHANTITIGDAVNCLVDYGIHNISIRPHRLRWIDNQGLQSAVTLVSDYKANQEVLGHVIRRYG